VYHLFVSCNPPPPPHPFLLAALKLTRQRLIFSFYPQIKDDILLSSLFKGTVHKIEIFFGFDFEMYYFFISYVKILRFYKKKNFDQAIIGGDTIFRLV
jgi:hypothetical protein